MRQNSDASSSGVGAIASSMAGVRQGTGGPNKSRYRGVSYDKKKRKWRVQIKVKQLEAQQAVLMPFLYMDVLLLG